MPWSNICLWLLLEVKKKEQEREPIAPKISHKTHACLILNIHDVNPLPKIVHLDL